MTPGALAARGTVPHPSASVVGRSQRLEGRLSAEIFLSDMISRVVPHAVERGAAHCLAHTETVQNSHTGRHQSFAAWFLSGEMAALEELHLQATSSKQNRKSGTCNAGPGN